MSMNGKTLNECARTPNNMRYGSFGIALKDWLWRANRSQKELAYALHVDPSTVTNWALGRKRPEGKLLVRMLALFRGWLGDDWPATEALDAISCLGLDWSVIEEIIEQRFEEGGKLRMSQSGGMVCVLRNAFYFFHLVPPSM